MPGKGRPFTKGCKPGPGRPRKSARLKAYADAVRKAITPLALAKILRRLARRALDRNDSGALRAAEAVIRATLGNDPAAALDVYERLEAIEERYREREEREQESAPQCQPERLATEDTGDGTTGNSTDNGAADDSWLSADGAGGVDDDDPKNWAPGRLF
jgi:hypothetical protein